jgi:hypothetical protein
LPLIDAPAEELGLVDGLGGLVVLVALLGAPKEIPAPVTLVGGCTQNKGIMKDEMLRLGKGKLRKGMMTRREELFQNSNTRLARG